ncbi:MAG: copper amine oxidase N-terminal domain-containing protein [Clostridiales Family XIII bacterium]|jgi:hypothetical protein|nr:copper amine oxidase N-terminal domain-containing protein [Clostridiales Family XIII bacterium]
MNIEKAKGILVGFIVSSILFGVAATVYASVGTYPLMATFANVKIHVNGRPIIPRDANGAMVEPFIVNGTTYLPVRAVSEALGMKVAWDGEAKIVSVGEAPVEPDPPAPVVTPTISHEDTLKQWLAEKGADLRALLEAYFGEGTKVYTRVEGSKLVLEIAKTTSQVKAEDQAKLESDYLDTMMGMASDYQQMLDLLRADTGISEVTMDVWHYLNETLVYTQEVR